MSTVLYLALPCPRCGAAPGEPCVRKDGQTLATRSHGGRTPLAPCGTKGGYERHKREHTTPCEECREANRRYTAEYRRRNPDVRDYDVTLLRARREAVRRLIELHRGDFDRLMVEEKAAFLGVDA